MALMGLFAVAVGVQCVIAGVPPHEYPQEFRTMMDIFEISFIFALILLAITLLTSFARAAKEALMQKTGIFRHYGRKIRGYLGSATFAKGLVGILLTQITLLMGPQKSLIQYLNPYKWDPDFAAWDKALHFGRYPHELAAALIDKGGAWMQGAVTFVYMSWFFVVGGSCLYFMFADKNDYRHMRFLWAYMLSWIILGSVCAMLFSSVGPLYYHDFYPQEPDIYQPLLAHLKTALEGHGFGFFHVVQLLLEWARNNSMLDVNAISAMPSMHVGIAWLLLLYWREISPRAAILSALFFGMILLGSVYLGYHYAIDGYFAILGVSLIWQVSGLIVRRLHPALAPQSR
jgi:hypothetical protein